VRNDMSNGRALLYMLMFTLLGVGQMECQKRSGTPNAGCGSRDYACEQDYDAADSSAP
jgi:hypothetical protein